MADNLPDGIASDYGKRLTGIGRVSSADEILYRTEKYSERTFGWDINLFGDGDYVLVMKFAEVYFQQPGEKVKFKVSIRLQLINYIYYLSTVH